MFISAEKPELKQNLISVVALTTYFVRAEAPDAKEVASKVKT